MSVISGRSSPGLLRHPDFLRLWTGQTISAFGTQVTILAIPIVAALSLRVSPFEFALLGALEMLPFVFLGLPAGVWVDRLRRRPILIVADLGRAVALLSIPLAAAGNVLTIWQLYAVVIVAGCFTVFFDVAWQSYLPFIVAPGQLVDGNAKLELTRTISQRLGPGLAGLLIGIITAPFAIVADALSFIGSALFIGSIRATEPVVPARPVDAPRPSMRADIGAGLRFVTGQSVLRAMALAVALEYLFSTVADSILILHLVRERGMGPELIGLAFTLGSVGVIGGALIAGWLTRRVGVGTLIVIAAIGGSVSWLPVAFAPDALLFAGLGTTITALSFFGVLWNINAVSLRQAVTPAAIRGRMTATMRFISWCTIPVGTLAGGWLGGVIGLHETIVVGAVGCLVTSLPVVLSPIRAIRAMPEAAGEETAAATRAGADAAAS